MTLSRKTRILNVFRKVFANPVFDKLLAIICNKLDTGSLIAKIVPSNYLYQRPSIRFATRNGINYRLDISDLVDWHIYFGFNEKEHEILYSLINQKDFVLDIGTNVGSVLMNLAKITKEGKVFGFEPDAGNFQRCKANLALNNFNNISVHNLGFGETNLKGQMLVTNELNRGMNKIITSDNSTSEIEIITVDEFVVKNGINKVDIMKIDTEGYEYKILKGAEKTLDKFSPKLFIELDEENLRFQSSSALELLSFLTNRNYQVFNVLTNEKIDKSSNFSNCHFDILAVRN